MRIETKLDIGDKAFILMQSKVHEVEIDRIEINIYGGQVYSVQTTSKYWIKKNPAGDQYTKCFYGHEIFETKELLLQSL